VTTEHFVLQGARSATIAESTGRANMFLAAVCGRPRRPRPGGDRQQLGSGVLRVWPGSPPDPGFVGFVTFERTLQSSIEDTEYARRIALLRGYYFGHAPEITTTG
jgi:hypothetical protein